MAQDTQVVLPVVLQELVTQVLQAVHQAQDIQVPQVDLVDQELVTQVQAAQVRQVDPELEVTPEQVLQADLAAQVQDIREQEPQVVDPVQVDTQVQELQVDLAAQEQDTPVLVHQVQVPQEVDPVPVDTLVQELPAVLDSQVQAPQVVDLVQEDTQAADRVHHSLVARELLAHPAVEPLVHQVVKDQNNQPESTCPLLTDNSSTATITTTTITVIWMTAS